MDPGLAIQQSGTTSRNVRKTTDIVFYGGTIRSAAFCSDALRRTLQDNISLEYLSYVSRRSSWAGNTAKKLTSGITKRIGITNYLNARKPMLGAYAIGRIPFWELNLSLGAAHTARFGFHMLFLLAAAVDFLFGEILREMMYPEQSSV